MKEGLCSDVRVGLEGGNTCWDCGVGDWTSDRWMEVALRVSRDREISVKDDWLKITGGRGGLTLQVN